MQVKNFTFHIFFLAVYNLHPVTAVARNIQTSHQSHRQISCEIKFDLEKIGEFDSEKFAAFDLEKFAEFDSGKFAAFDFREICRV